MLSRFEYVSTPKYCVYRFSFEQRTKLRDYFICVALKVNVSSFVHQDVSILTFHFLLVHLNNRFVIVQKPTLLILIFDVAHIMSHIDGSNVIYHGI